MSDATMWQVRLRKVAAYGMILLVAGFCYGIFVQKTGLAVPCLFRQVTGFQCPGCGVTRMCVALLQLDFAKAFQSNQALFLLAPVMGIVFLKYLVDYIRNGTWKLNQTQTYILYVCIAVLVIFGIARNVLPL